MTDEQILPVNLGGHVAAHNRLGRRLTLLQEQVDALSSLENATRERLDAVATNMAEQSDMKILTRRIDVLHEAFLRHTHTDGVTGENAVKASVEHLEAVRHDG